MDVENESLVNLGRGFDVTANGGDGVLRQPTRAVTELGVLLEIPQLARHGRQHGVEMNFTVEGISDQRQRIAFEGVSLIWQRARFRMPRSGVRNIDEVLEQRM
jgi:hypothetical protein